ncbi:unnamed protein product, partial [Ectocarpus fasciculatus]
PLTGHLVGGCWALRCRDPVGPRARGGGPRRRDRPVASRRGRRGGLRARAPVLRYSRRGLGGFFWEAPAHEGRGRCSGEGGDAAGAAVEVDPHPRPGDVADDAELVVRPLAEDEFGSVARHERDVLLAAPRGQGSDEGDGRAPVGLGHRGVRDVLLLEHDHFF